MLLYEPVSARGPHTIEISKQNCRFLRWHRAEPGRSNQQFRLQAALASAETKMTVDNVHRTEIGFRLYPDRAPLLAAVPGRRTRHLGGTFQHDRKAAHDRVAVLLVADAHCRMKVIFPTELFGDQRPLVDR